MMPVFPQTGINNIEFQILTPQVAIGVDTLLWHSIPKDTSVIVSITTSVSSHSTLLSSE